MKGFYNEFPPRGKTVLLNVNLSSPLIADAVVYTDEEMVADKNVHVRSASILTESIALKNKHIKIQSIITHAYTHETGEYDACAAQPIKYQETGPNSNTPGRRKWRSVVHTHTRAKSCCRGTTIYYVAAILWPPPHVRDMCFAPRIANRKRGQTWFFVCTGLSFALEESSNRSTRQQLYRRNELLNRCR